MSLLMSIPTAGAQAAAAAVQQAAKVAVAPLAQSTGGDVAGFSLFDEVRNFFGLHTITSVDEKSIQNFRFEQGVTPLSNWPGVAICVALYFLIVRSMQRWVKLRGKPYDLNGYVIVHNSLLSIMSAVLFFSLVNELYQRFRTTGVWTVFCDPMGVHAHGTIYFVYYVNYIFKYIELIDTFLLALRGKPIPFLHIYHHAATLVLCWSQLWAQSCIQWLPIVINLLVHVIMYAYYTLHALGLNIWWKKYLTMFQIVQFIVALTGCVGMFTIRLSAVSWGITKLEEYGCYGTNGGAWIGIFIIASYLYLFVRMYQNTYKKGGRSKANKTPASGAVKPLPQTSTGFEFKKEKEMNGNGLHHE